MMAYRYGPSPATGRLCWQCRGSDGRWYYSVEYGELPWSDFGASWVDARGEMP